MSDAKLEEFAFFVCSPLIFVSYELSGGCFVEGNDYLCLKFLETVFVHSPTWSEYDRHTRSSERFVYNLITFGFCVFS